MACLGSEYSGTKLFSAQKHRCSMSLFKEKSSVSVTVCFIIIISKRKTFLPEKNLSSKWLINTMKMLSLLVWVILLYHNLPNETTCGKNWGKSIHGSDSDRYKKNPLPKERIFRCIVMEPVELSRCILQSFYSDLMASSADSRVARSAG